MVEESFQYHADPANEEVARRGWRDTQTCREVSNHALPQESHPAPDGGKPSYTAMRNELPEWKQRWSEWDDVYSKCLQIPIRRIKHGETAHGYEVDRDLNAAVKVLDCGLEKLEVVHSERTPVETAATADTESISASRVVEAGSLCPRKPPQAASTQG